jgi:hypothetical protein
MVSLDTRCARDQLIFSNLHALHSPWFFLTGGSSSVTHGEQIIAPRFLRPCFGAVTGSTSSSSPPTPTPPGSVLSYKSIACSKANSPESA